MSKTVRIYGLKRIWGRCYFIKKRGTIEVPRFLSVIRLNMPQNRNLSEEQHL